MHPVFTVLEGERTRHKGSLEKKQLGVIERSAVLLLPGLPMSRTILFELQVDNPFYGHNENRKLHFLQKGWFCNLFFWVEVTALLNSKV